MRIHKQSDEDEEKDEEKEKESITDSGIDQSNQGSAVTTTNRYILYFGQNVIMVYTLHACRYKRQVKRSRSDINTSSTDAYK